MSVNTQKNKLEKLLNWIRESYVSTKNDKPQYEYAVQLTALDIILKIQSLIDESTKEESVKDKRIEYLEEKLKNALDPRNDESELVAGQRVKCKKTGKLGTILRVNYSTALCPFKVVFDGDSDDNYFWLFDGDSDDNYFWLDEPNVEPITRFIGVDIDTGKYFFEDM